MSLKIDVFNHIFPKPFFERLQQVIVNRGAVKRWLNIPFLHDLDVRFRMLDEFGADYRQVLSLSAPPIESINPDRQITIDLATAGERLDGGIVARASGPVSGIHRVAAAQSSRRERRASSSAR